MRPETRALIDRRESTLGRLRELLISDLSVRLLASEIDPDVPLFGVGLGLDSVDAIELAFIVEKAFDVTLPNDEALAIVTRSLNCLVDHILSQQGDPATGSGHAEGAEPSRANAAYRALRTSTVFYEPAEGRVLEVVGARAFEALDRVLPCDLFLHDGQARPTLLLDERARIIADVTVARLDQSYLLFVDGLDGPAARALVEARAGEPVEIKPESGLSIFSIHGPYAWELTAAWMGRGIVGLPPLALVRTPRGIVLRGGRTGEFGYDVLVPREKADEERARLLELGRRYDLVEASRDVIDHAVIESAGFTMTTAQGRDLSPVEAQLQWRVSGRKEYWGRAALDARRAAATQQISWFRSPSRAASGSQVTLDGDPVGSVLRALPAWEGEGSLGLLILDRHSAHPGLTLRATPGDVELRTASAPLIQPLSWRVRPQVDSYQSRPA